MTPRAQDDYVAPMTIRPIHIIPDNVLRERAEPVGEITPEIRTLVEDMYETMYAAPGIGLAAPQLGVLKRIAVVDVSNRDEDQAPLTLIDPQIVWSSEETSVYEEGCLSIPDHYAEVERPASVRVRYRDIEGRQHEIEAEGVLATCIQHEIDHLDGVLFVDLISKLKRDMIWKRFAKLAKRDGGAKPWLPEKRRQRDLADEQQPAETLGEL